MPVLLDNDGDISYTRSMRSRCQMKEVAGITTAEVTAAYE